jgi:hypothetical protein
MNFISHSPKPFEYSSARWCESRTMPGVRGICERSCHRNPRGTGAVGSRNKKLLIAFQFQFSSPAAWDCESCRKSGLAEVRNCAWLVPCPAAARKPVWARSGLVTYHCPKSLITAESLAFLESYQLAQRCGREHLLSLDARTGEAILILENASRNQDK